MKKYLKIYKKQQKYLESYYQNLVFRTKRGEFIGATNEWVLDNYYMIVEKEDEIKNFFSNGKNYRDTFLKKNIYPIIREQFIKENFQFRLEEMTNCLLQFEKENGYCFSYETIANIRHVSFLIILEMLCDVCKKEEINYQLRQKAYSILEKIKQEPESLEYLEIFLDVSLLKEPAFLERFYSLVKESGKQSISILERLNALLEEKNINLNEIIEKYYEDIAEISILISNIFASIQQLSKVENETLYYKISSVEQILLKDKTYKIMTKESKDYYRHKIKKNAKKNKQTELEYVKKMMYESGTKHIGFLLFPHKKSNYKNLLYVTFVFATSLILSLAFAPYLFIPSFLGALVLFIPMSELVIQLTNKVLLKFFKPHPLPKLDFRDKIKDEYRSMVVITTIVKNAKKVEQVFRNLEAHYLLSPKGNVHFTLLGDAASYNQENAPFDQEIIKAGIECCDRLNKKYKSDSFHFIYRKRKYSVGESTYLGWERKRGALQQFNQLLLGKLSKQEKEEYFHVATVDSSLNIKYIIALDADTKPGLGSIPLLIGTMAHPLNNPVLNTSHTKVIQGYGIMQPKVTFDISLESQSTYSQIFAGLGGYDVYSSVVPELYQDVFGESNFYGKGIYDLAIFNEVIVNNNLPTNRILSHDLLEGSYLRCGHVSDVDFYDDFPNDFLIDSTRQHRWARGDMQILTWSFKKNPLNLMHRFKIFDNIRRGLLSFNLLLILLLAYTVSPVNSYYWFLFVTFILLIPILFFIVHKIRLQNQRSTKTKQYQNTIIGLKSIVLRIVAAFSSLPYHTKLYLDAFSRSIYRMVISKKNLLNWVTAEEASKTTKKDFITYLVRFKLNYVVSFALLILVYLLNPSQIFPVLLISFTFLASPLYYYLMGQVPNKKISGLSGNEKQDFFQLAEKTWQYFNRGLIKKNHFLIPDNYQKNRENNYDKKTSPTDIGFSILAVISAYKLELVSKKKCIYLLDHIIATVEKLKKWNGHLYNWYNVETEKVMFPYYISTVDSGNFVASLITLKEFCKEQKEDDLVSRCEALIRKTNFTKLFCKDTNTFTIGYDTIEEKKSPFNYDKFASEFRVTSYIAIAKGDVSYKHWFSLDKSLTKFHHYKGLLSWSGTSFEYYMPLLFMNNYPNTLMDESYHFAMLCQKEYQKEINPNFPWGISESAYNVLDDAKNYKYKAFGTPYLKFQNLDMDRKVISPYASLLALVSNPREVYNNYLKWKDLKMVGKLGCYEAYDLEDDEIVYAYFAHHQGMILTSLVNYLKDNLIKKYFNSDINIEAFDILNKEKLQIKPMIDMKINSYKVQEYLKEPLENDVRVYHSLQKHPEVSALSNARYMLLMNERGNGFSRYKDIQLNRYRKVSDQDYGCYLYIRDKNTNHIWSNTYAPTNKKPKRYEVTFALDRLKYQRVDQNIMTNTEIIVTKKHNAEIRKITFKNIDSRAHSLEVTTYQEPIVCSNKDDIGHRTFNSMFLKSEYLKDYNALIFGRNVRNSENKYYFVHKLWSKEFDTNSTYETERTNFLKRNDSYAEPWGLSQKLTNYVGDTLDPIASIRNVFSLEPGEEKTVYILNGFGTSQQQILDILDYYMTEDSIEDAFRIVTLTTDKMMKQLGITSRDVNCYNKALNYLYQTTKLNLTEDRRTYLEQNKLSQNNLWRFGVSGDIPIILVEIESVSSLGLVKELLKMFEYYKNRGIYADMVIINSSDLEQAAMIREAINNELYYIYSYHDPASYKGSIKVIERISINDEELNLFRSICRLSFNTNTTQSLRDYIESFQIQNQDQKDTLIQNISLLPLPKKKLDFDNGFGGFDKNGAEYVIYNKNTPMPWSNVLANDSFGTVVTNNNNGFTYAYNSKEYKLTTWTNDLLLDDPSEWFVINSKNIIWDRCTHGFGYSIFNAETKDYSLEYTTFVPKHKNLKVNLVTIDSNQDQILDLTYLINPVLGESEDTTIRHLVTTFSQEANVLLIKNHYSKQFKNNCVYVTSTESVETVIDNPNKKGISIKLDVKKNQKITVAFLLGCEKNLDLNDIKKNQVLKTLKQDLSIVKDYWKEQLSKITINTNNKDFDYMMNGWYLYQTLASRILARSGFYQVGGAFGFRDQLQDCMNICITHPEFTKKQILNCASHQFIEGDVLHWWHENSQFGLRSRFKDDYLWLVFATYEYLQKTGDKTILNEQVPFVLGLKLEDYEEERGMDYSYSDETASLFEHLKIIMNKAKHEIGDNGLPLMGGGDWNDGMNHIGINGQGTSIWLGFFLYEVLNRYIDICQKYKLDDDIIEYEKLKKDLKKSLRKNGWDQKYYLRAITDDGTKIGSLESRECQIDLISQSFSILTDIAKKEQIPLILESVDTMLADEKTGMVKLLTPAFSNTWKDVGYIQNYPQGIRENGGQYTHATAWYVMALAHLGLYNKAYQYFKMLNPIYHSNTIEKCKIYQVEPYVIPADIYSHESFYGKGGWTWYTGSSGWFYKVGLETMLGFYKEADTLKVVPNIIQSNYEIMYKYYDTIYKIEVKNGKKAEIKLDKRKVDFPIKLINDKKEHSIVVIKEVK